MNKPTAIPLPAVFSRGPDAPVDLGTTQADFWTEDASGNRIKDVKKADVQGKLLLYPKDSVLLTTTNTTSFDMHDTFAEGKAYIHISNHNQPIECIGGGNEDVGPGWIPLQTPIDIQHSLESGQRVEFVLFSFPDFSGDHDVHLAERNGDEEKKSTWWRSGQIIIEHSEWQIQISAHNKTKAWCKVVRESGGLAATHTGRIRKREGKGISWCEAKNIIRCLHNFLSFARGHWQPLGYIRLLSGGDECLCEKWGILQAGYRLTDSSMSWWSSHPQAHLLSDVFGGFWNLWNDPLWKNALPEVIYWYLQANLAGKGHLGADAALVLSQTVLEKLSWTYVTQAKKAVFEDAFQPGKLTASDQIRLLATLLDLPYDIPHTLASVKEDAKGNEFEDAFHAITVIRNQLVHSKKKLKLKEHAAFYTWNLSQWYVEMCLLRLMDYQGEYANRLNMRKWVGDTELVPWAKKKREDA